MKNSNENCLIGLLRWLWKERNFLSKVAVVVAVSVFVGCHIDRDVVVKEESIVLTFIGILATFIVVDNWMRIEKIKDKVDSHMKRMEEMKGDVRNTQVGMCIMYAEMYADDLSGKNVKNEDKALSSLHYYLTAITVGIDDTVSIIDPNVYKCIDGLKSLCQIVKVKGIDQFKDNKTNEVSIGDAIAKIRSQKNYPCIKHQFEELLVNKSPC
jgi:hypothetical protein